MMRFYQELISTNNKLAHKDSEFSLSISNWYKKNGRENLPWREDISPYRIWISEVMLQQTQVKTVIPFFNSFISNFPDLNKLSYASEENILALWTGLGFYRRAKNIYKAKEVIKKLDTTIRKKRKLIATKKFSSKIERNREKNELASIIREKAAETKVFSSSVGQIKAIAESNELPKVNPKYRVRGFWSIPEPKKVGDEISQEVVQFIARYRYVSSTGKTSVIEQIKFNKKTAAFSNWVEVKGPIRKREKQADGGYRWILESEEDSQAINFNSIDLSIQPGEKIEMMIKSVSEAGFPQTPVESEWSDIITIPFPDGEISTDGANSLVNQNDLDNVKVEINDDLESQGLFTHLDSGFTAGDTYYAHAAESLASGFLTGEHFFFNETATTEIYTY